MSRKTCTGAPACCGRPLLRWRPFSLMGGVAGYLDAHRADGGDGPSGLVAGGIVLLAGVGVMWLYLRRFPLFWQGWSRRKRLYTASIAGSVLLGLLTAILLRSGQADVTADPFFSNSALSPQIAILLALLWGAGISIAVFIYQRTIDDHEERAYLWAGLAGYYAFVIPAPMWWVLARRRPGTTGRCHAAVRTDDHHQRPRLSVAQVPIETFTLPFPNPSGHKRHRKKDILR